MKITYIYHSSFCVELEHVILLFDYDKGILPNFDRCKTLFIFVSHSHQDHFNPQIFHIEHPSIHYILSDDISCHYKKNVDYMGAHRTLQREGLQIHTLLSTDEGVAFLIHVEGYVIYHAGDLNWWDWGREDSMEERDAMKSAYQEEIAHIRDKIDVAFVPVDPRLEERYNKGLDYFMRNVHVKHVFAMHLWNDYHIIDRLRKDEQSTPYNEKIEKITRSNQEFHI